MPYTMVGAAAPGNRHAVRTGGLRSHLMPFAGRRYWVERARLTSKALVAAVVAWLIAKYLVGHQQPYRGGPP